MSTRAQDQTEAQRADVNALAYRHRPVHLIPPERPVSGDMLALIGRQGLATAVRHYTTRSHHHDN